MPTEELFDKSCNHQTPWSLGTWADGHVNNNSVALSEKQVYESSEIRLNPESIQRMYHMRFLKPDHNFATVTVIAEIAIRPWSLFGLNNF